MTIPQRFLTLALVLALGLTACGQDPNPAATQAQPTQAEPTQALDLKASAQDALTPRQVQDITSGQITSVIFPNGERVGWHLSPNGDVVTSGDISAGQVQDLPAQIDAYLDAFKNARAQGQVTAPLKGQGYGIGNDYQQIINRETYQYCTFWFIGCWNWATGVNVTTTTRTNNQRTWPQGQVFFRFDASAPQNLRDTFRVAVQEWNTQLQAHYQQSGGNPSYNVVPLWQESSTATNAVLVKGVRNVVYGGMSALGFQGGVQALEINLDCCATSKGLVMHEMGHAVGLVHEHQRPDRDQYVTVQPANAHQNYTGAFDIYPWGYRHEHEHGAFWSDPTLTAFDYESLMIYPTHGFSNTGQPTLLPKPIGSRGPNWTGDSNKMGTQTGLTWTDKGTLYVMYSNNR